MLKVLGYQVLVESILVKIEVLPTILKVLVNYNLICVL